MTKIEELREKANRLPLLPQHQNPIAEHRHRLDRNICWWTAITSFSLGPN